MLAQHLLISTQTQNTNEAHCNTDCAYFVSLRCMTFNDRKDVMEAQSTHLSIPQAHNITQHQSIRAVSFLTMDVEGLQLTNKRKLTGWNELGCLSKFELILYVLEINLNVQEYIFKAHQ